MIAEADSGELAAFVSSTLGAIAMGIKNAQDVQITSVHGTGASEEVFKVAVFGIGANAEGNSDDESSTVSRIRLVVPTKFKEAPKIKDGNSTGGTA